MTSHTPQLIYLNCHDSGSGHRMAYWEWGDAHAAHVVVCVHGLTRQGRDFDTLAQQLLQRSPHPMRVICPDVAGRGHSDWLQDPAQYQLPVYVADMLTLIAHLDARSPVVQLDWVGTSMGGLIGLILGAQLQHRQQLHLKHQQEHPHASTPAPQMLRRLVLNDVGPQLEWDALQRIGTYLGQNMHFATPQEGANALWSISTSFGPHTDQEWQALSLPMLKPVSTGGWRLHYDPALAQAFKAVTPEETAQGAATLWALYDSLRMPTLLLRGQDSDLLRPETAQAMTQRGPHAQLVQFAGVGHAPTLIHEDQYNAVVDFLVG